MRLEVKNRPVPSPRTPSASVAKLKPQKGLRRISGQTPAPKSRPPADPSPAPPKNPEKIAEPVTKKAETSSRRSTASKAEREPATVAPENRRERILASASGRARRGRKLVPPISAADDTAEDWCGEDQPDDGDGDEEDAKPELRFRIDNREWFGYLIPDWLAPRQQLTWTAKAVWGYLYRRLSEAEGFAFPKQETIAADLGISLRTVKDAIKNLNEHGLIATGRRQIKHGRWKTTKKKTAYFVRANHPWAKGAKTRQPRVEADNEDDE